MRIVHVSQSYYPRPSGVAEHVHHTAIELRRRGHDVTIVTARFGNDGPAEDGVVRVGHNILVPFNGGWASVTAGAHLHRDLARLFHEIQPDLIHTHCPLSPTLPLLTLFSAPKSCRIVGTFHEAAHHNYAYWLSSGVLKRFARRLDTRIAVSRPAESLARKYVGGDYVVIPNGVDPNRFSPGVRAFDHLRDDAFNVLYVGRLDKRKGVKYLFRAASLVSAQTCRRIRLIIVGNDDVRRRFLPLLPRSVDVHFAGVVTRDVLPRYFATADVFCSPAVGRESFGIVLLEAMAAGIPVIGTSIPGYLTLLADRWNALVVPPRDPHAIAGAVLELMDDDLLGLKLRENGRRFVEDYRWDSVAERILRVYSGDIDTPPTERPAAEPMLAGTIQIRKA